MHKRENPDRCYQHAEPCREDRDCYKLIDALVGAVVDVTLVVDGQVGWRFPLPEAEQAEA